MDFDKALGNLPQVLAIRSKRMEVLASNIANADTPNYKARDIDFKAALNGANKQQLAMQTTNKGHISIANSGMPASAEVYTIPSQPSLDGNTVDTNVEKAKFAKNALQLQATMQMLSGKFRGLTSAIRGE